MLHEHLETHVVGEDGGAVLKGSFVSDDYAILSLIKEQWISDIYNCCIYTNIDYIKVLISNKMWSYVRYPLHSSRPPPTENCTGLTRQKGKLIRCLEKRRVQQLGGK